MATHVRRPSNATTMTCAHLLPPGQLRGLWVSFGPSQSTMWSPLSGLESPAHVALGSDSGAVFSLLTCVPDISRDIENPR